MKKYDNLLWFKNKIILGLILLLGFTLRSYHLDFPSIGYHNMKENEYLSIAEEMLRTKDFVTRRVYFYNAFADNPIMKLYPQHPLVSYQTILSWKLFGDNLWGPRLFNVIFGVGSVLIIYYIGLILFSRKRMALLCALLLTIMPLAVFFSRNLQPESPAFFFMLLGNLFYLRFIVSFKKYNLFLGGLAFSLAWLYKFSFLIGVLPIIFCLSYKQLFKEKKVLLKSLLMFILPYLVILIAFLWLRYIGQWTFDKQETMSRVKLFNVFLSSYWKNYGRMIWWYIRGENYTIIYTILALLGIFIAFFRRRSLLNLYIIGWLFSLIPYCMVFSDHINQHNYYQMPFLGLICISSVYAMAFISGQVKKFFKKDLFIYLLIFIMVLSISPLYSAIVRMYNTIFFGEDVAGESLKEFTSPPERIFLLTHCQGYGIARYARRYTGWTEDTDDFKDKEKRFNIRYICFYPAKFALSLKANNPSLFDHIQNNYHTKEVGLTEEPSQLYYIILEKGRGSDPQAFLQSFFGARQLRTIYKVLNKRVFFYSLRQ